MISQIKLVSVIAFFVNDQTNKKKNTFLKVPTLPDRLDQCLKLIFP